MIKKKKKSRGFGFLSFENDAAVERATADHFVNLNGKQVEIKKAEPRDGLSQNSSMAVDSYQWGGSAMPQMGNGQQMSGPPPMNMPPMGMPNMNQGYQQWNTSQSQGYGAYGSNNSNASFGGWPPHQWGAPNYGAPPQPQQSQGYGAYDSYGTYNSTAANTGSGSTGDMYSRPQSGTNAPPAGAPPAGGPGATNISKPGSDYNGYSAYGGANYYNDQQTYNGRPRSAYGTEGTQQYF